MELQLRQSALVLDWNALSIWAKKICRQALNVFRIHHWSSVRPVTSGTATLKDATSEAIRYWVTNVETTHYILGSAAASSISNAGRDFHQ